MNKKHLVWFFALCTLAPFLAHATGSPATMILNAPLKDIDGKARSIGEWNGKLRVVSFWASWCAPCRNEIPLLEAARRQYLGKGVEVIGVAVDRDEDVRAFLQQEKIGYPVLLAQQEGQALMRSGGNPFAALPFTLLLDQHGAILERHQGAVDARLLKQWLAKPVSNPPTTKGSI
jgi:thiol-disulfide isomerase/thioredoxin